MVILTALLGIACYLAYTTDGPHSEFIRNSEDTVLWGLYWVWVSFREFFLILFSIMYFCLAYNPYCIYVITSRVMQIQVKHKKLRKVYI